MRRRVRINNGRGRKYSGEGSIQQRPEQKVHFTANSSVSLSALTFFRAPSLALTFPFTLHPLPCLVS